MASSLDKGDDKSFQSKNDFERNIVWVIMVVFFLHLQPKSKPILVLESHKNKTDFTIVVVGFFLTL